MGPRPPPRPPGPVAARHGEPGNLWFPSPRSMPARQSRGQCPRPAGAQGQRERRSGLGTLVSIHRLREPRGRTCGPRRHGYQPHAHHLHPTPQYRDTPPPIDIHYSPRSPAPAQGYAEQAVVICRAALDDAVFRTLWPLAPPIWAVRGAFRPDSRPYGRTCPSKRPRAR